MPSLTDVYDGATGRVASRRQKLLGRGLFVLGAAALVGAIAVSTTNAGYQTFGERAARELGGTLAGVGLPAVLLGVFAVLPASLRVRVAAAVGAAVAVLGVVLFRTAYPYDWVAADPLFALAVTSLYFFGVVTILWSLFVALATFKTRNDPGGTARMEITREGTIRMVEEADEGGTLGGIGLLGSDPDGSVATQTNRRGGTASDGGSASQHAAGTGIVGQSGAGSAPSRTDRQDGDGGLDTVGRTQGRDDVRGDGAAEDTVVDAYCGNCRHFEYVQKDGEPQAHCSFHGRDLDDMEACSAWIET